MLVVLQTAEPCRVAIAVPRDHVAFTAKNFNDDDRSPAPGSRATLVRIEHSQLKPSCRLEVRAVYMQNLGQNRHMLAVQIKDFSEVISALQVKSKVVLGEVNTTDPLPKCSHNAKVYLDR